jgi:excisionase family DNA binding protein
MRQAELQTQAEPDWLTVPEVAALCTVSVGTVRLWIHGNRFGWRDRGYKIGGALRFKRQDVLDWIESRRGDQMAVARRRGSLATILGDAHQ